MKNYYEILEVNEHASQDIIEKAYKILIKKYHPDLYVGEEKRLAEQKVRELNEAYQVLSDDFLKSQYDMELRKVKGQYNNYQYETNNVKTSDRNNIKQYENLNNSSMNFEPKSEKETSAKKSNVGTIGSMIGIVKELIKVFSNRKAKSQNGKKSKEDSRLDLVALGLTIICLIIIGIILWFVPFTNGWMRQLIFENPLFGWIWR